ncbi:Rhodanese-like domain-containing protein [Auriculariales sp. MPI-PUGE-AT-0066]|nr:Rhodanese-like domain-containing protein [Auriculariales sp. MPI-PUGE-AT-0066]
MAELITTSASAKPLFSWVTPSELKEVVSAKQARSDYVVIDVRDADREGGHIVGSVHSPSNTFDDAVDALVEQHKEAGTVVFHCALSQQRGPKAARIYAETLQQRYPDSKQDVVVLRGGFTDFQSLYRKDPKLVEGWQADYWEY